MRSYRVSIQGVTPLMMHRDNMEFKAEVKRWQIAPENNDKSVAGDDRSPAWGWIGAVYHDGQNVAVPTDCVMASVMGAAGGVKIGKGAKTFKSQTQSGMAFMEPFLSFSVNGGTPLPFAPIAALRHADDFDHHMTSVRAMGFALDIRRAKPAGSSSKHVRVRPVFEKWSATGILNVWDDALSEDVLKTIFYQAGDKHGLMEWRPSAKRPGPFGRFRAEMATT